MADEAVAIPAISIIIPHRDDAAGLGRTMAALARLDPASPEFEAIVADNGSAGGVASAEDVVAAHAGPALADRVRVVAAAPSGAGPARNAGAAVARGAVLAFLDCDCEPAAGWLLAVQSAAQDSVVGGPVQVVRVAGPHAALQPAEAFDMLFGFHVPRSFRRDGLLLTANLAVPASLFAVIGPFRSGISEDMEWCHRAAAMGHPPRLVMALGVTHAALDSEAKLKARWDRVVRETWLYRKERGLGRAGWLWTVAVVAVSPLLHAPRAVFAPLGPGGSPTLRLRLLALLVRIRWRRAMLGLRLWWSG